MPINPVFVDKLKAAQSKDPAAGAISVYDLVLKRLAQMTTQQPAFDPFQGPIADRKGTLRVVEGQRLSQQELMTMEWAALGVVGPWANEP
jgi:simple sugar transport system substrate-binding protein